MKSKSDNLVSTIARKEFLEMWRDGRFRWLTGIVTLTLLASFLAGWYSYREAKADREKAQIEERERWLGKGEMSGHEAAHFGVFVFRPDTPLSVIDQGVTPYTGSSVFLEAHSRNLFEYRPAGDTPAARRYGELTAAAVLQMFVPLLIVLLCYPVFVGEREQGTLRQLSSFGVSPRTLAFGKLLGIVAPLFLMLIPLALVGVITLAFYAGADFTAEMWWRLIPMTLAYLMYFVIFIGISLIASTIAASSRQTLVVLLAFWFINCLLLPQVFAAVSQRIYPAMDGFELPTAIQEAKTNLPTRERRQIEVEKRLLEQYAVEKVEDLPVDPKRVVNMEIEADSDRIQEKYYNQLHDTYEKQDRFYQAGAILAPMMALQSISMTLSGTHFAEHRHFADAAEAYRQQLIRIMDEADLYSENAKPKNATRVVQNSETWAKVPPFEYTPPNLAWSLEKNVISIVILTVWFIAIVALTPLVILKLKVD